MRAFVRWWFVSLGTTLFLSVLLFLFVLFLSVRAVGPELTAFAQTFERGAGRSLRSVGLELGVALGLMREQELAPVRVVLLGTDQVSGSGRTDVLTDTIMLITYQPSQDVVRMMHVPRDLYLEEYQRKVNQLYAAGLLHNPRFPVQPLLDSLPEVFGYTPDAVLVLSIADIEDLIDTIGGVTVRVERSFVDTRFPRPGVDVTTERDPAVLYETVEFVAGEQRMDGATALKFMRSRHSSDPLEGNDEARARRQQLVLRALVDELIVQDLVQNPELLGRLYRWYADHLGVQVPPAVAVRLAAPMLRKGVIPRMEAIALPATDLASPPTPETILVHPPLSKYRGAWVYELVDPTGQQLRAFLQAQGM